MILYVFFGVFMVFSTNFDTFLFHTSNINELYEYFIRTSYVIMIMQMNTFIMYFMNVNMHINIFNRI